MTLFVAACQSKTPQPDMSTKTNLQIEKKSFGQHNDQDVLLYTLHNGTMSISIATYGGIVQSIILPDREGTKQDIALGFNTLEDYVAEHPYFGALIGRYGNRIANGAFSLDGISYTLAINNGLNSLHGGVQGFDKKIWDCREIWREDAIGIVLTGVSDDMEEGYPGHVTLSVEYWLTLANELEINYRATTSAPTVINLTNHSYFNLNGEGNGDILGHELTLYADAFTPVDAALIPLGTLMSVTNTPFDFTTSHPIGARIESEHPQMIFGGGYDHNYALNRKGDSRSLAAEVYSPQSGIGMKVYTSEPGIQFYSGNFLEGTLIGKQGKSYPKRSGFCLETQHFPDSPNQPSFPSTVLRPGDIYQTSTVYRFFNRA